ncbi:MULTISPECIES: universal stress protein [Streptomyces]|uniref:Universal stress protein n=1 Tax=Streptomyces chilikensis TaxID=1194079 RepID=A0ABV3EVI9_9ACTN|nr:MULTISPECIES: universal stress protein [Streptomyces]MDH6228297.1 nucleotide-binding universal stress UspA family protein [Streptomyces sp. MJP52]
MNEPVIVGVDGSPSAFAAVDTAADEAHLRGVPLRIVHAFGNRPSRMPGVTPPPEMTGRGLAGLVHGVPSEAERRAHDRVPGLEVTRSVVSGEPLEVLTIESRSAALAVVGSRGLNSFSSLLLGSTAVHLAAHGHCPLMVVRGRPSPTGPVLLAVDGSEAGEAAVAFAFAEAALHGAPLVAMHVWNTRNERALDDPLDPLHVVTDVSRIEEAQRRLLDGTLARHRAARPDVVVEPRLVRSRIRSALLTASGDARLVVVGARGRGGFQGLLLGSVSQALLHHADCPVIVVRGRH